MAARRHGLPLPIPATYRFPGIEDADESAWQDSVVRHLDLEDWVRVEVTDELDLVGPVAGPLLRRFGPLWPPNSHFGGLLVPHARGGTFVTGVGGDELLEPGAHVVARLLVEPAEATPAGSSLRGGRDGSTRATCLATTPARRAPPMAGAGCCRGIHASAALAKRKSRCGGDGA